MRQVYVMPTRDCWAVVTYGDPILPDDEILPLPLTRAVSYDDVVAFVKRQPVGQGAYVDGWPTMLDLRRCEPTLWERI